MSGGSWDYVYGKIRETAVDLMNSSDPMRRALGKRLLPFADALHDIEWVDSCDYGPGDEVEAIKAALGDNWRERAMDELIAQHEELIAKWRELVEEAR